MKKFKQRLLTFTQKKTNEEIEEFKELMGLNFSDGGKKLIDI